MYFPDLGHACQIADGPRIRAVGWLDAEHEFPRGPVDPLVAAALDRLAEEGWVHVHAAGFHTCELCDDAHDARNVLVPGTDVLYVAPAMVVHYMRDHDYLPPAGFRVAVCACPDPKSDAYFAELKRFAPDLSNAYFELTDAAFDLYTQQHRAWREEVHAQRAAKASRKGFTWD